MRNHIKGRRNPPVILPSAAFHLEVASVNGFLVHDGQATECRLHPRCVPCLAFALHSLTMRTAQVPPTNPDDATKQALLAVVQVWLDRLQAMAVIVSPASPSSRAYTHHFPQTSFFVSIDSMIYSFPYRNPDLTAWTSLDLLISASLGGAIILHVCACE